MSFPKSHYPMPCLQRFEPHRDVGYIGYDVQYRLFVRLLEVSRSLSVRERSRCLLASVLATSSQLQSLLTASGRKSKTLPINSMLSALSKFAVVLET